jgi:1,4-dihydroxy-2-naphthoate octaprenyltransferase
MKLIYALKELSRPKTLVASISPVLLASAYSLKNDVFSASLFVVLFLNALMLQILANIANDYFDGIKGADHHQRVGPVRLTGSGLVPQQTVKKILIINFCICLIMGLFLSYYGGPLVAAVFGVSLISSLLYTAGPYAFAYKGLAEPFAFSFFGPIPTFFACYIYSKSFSFYSLLLGILPGLYSLILITINNLRDYESDAQAAKMTIIVKKGRSFGKKMILTSVIFQFTTLAFLGLYQPKMLFCFVSLPETIYFVKQVTKSQTPEEFAYLLKSCAKLYATSSLLWICFTMI